MNRNPEAFIFAMVNSIDKKQSISKITMRLHTQLTQDTHKSISWLDAALSTKPLLAKFVQTTRS
jgi:hypothetical protein